MTNPNYICPFEILEIIYVMATQRISQEANNYVRLDLAIKDTCTKCLRDVLHNCVPAGFQDINHALQFLEPCLRQHLESYKYSQLFSNRQLLANFSVSECDMSLVYSLIRNSNWVPPPTVGWGKSVTNSPQDRSLGANVERLHLFRNKLDHRKEPSISNQDFHNYWTEVRKCVSDIETSLGSTKHQQSLDCLRMKDLDPDYANRIINEFNDAVRDLQAEQCIQSVCLLEIRDNQSGHGSTLSDIRNSLNEQSKDLLDLKTEESNQSKLLRDLAIKSEQQNQLLQNDRKVFSDIKTSHDHLDLSIGEALDALKDQDTGLVRIAKEQKNQTCSLQSIDKKLEEMHKNQTLLLNNNKESLKKIQEIVERRVQCEVRNENVTGEVAGCEGIQRLSLEELENTDRINQQYMNDRESEEASCTDSTNIGNQHHNETDNKGAPNDALNCDMSRENYITNDDSSNIRNQHQNEADNDAATKDSLDSNVNRENEISIAVGRDGVICLIKQYCFIKSSLSKRNVRAIVDCFLKEGLISNDEHETISYLYLPKRVSIDHLLKKIILGDSDRLKTFFKVLESVNPTIARTLAATEVTDQERSRFREVEERALQVKNASAPSDSACKLDNSEICFFQYHLLASQEDVDSINDAMLSRFNFSVLDHSNVLHAKTPDKKIQKLCQTMNLCAINFENELKNFLSSSLYKKWIEFRKKRGNNDRQHFLRWFNAAVNLVSYVFGCSRLRFNQAETGSIILKFAVEDGFNMASLTRCSLQENITDLLWKGYMETQINMTKPVHVTVFIMSPRKNGQEEIHFYLDFDTADDARSREDPEHENGIQERKILLEELDPTELSEWITKHLDVQKTKICMFKDKLSGSHMHGKEEMIVFLDSMYELEIGRDLIQQFCNENDFMYYRLSVKIKQPSNRMLGAQKNQHLWLKRQSEFQFPTYSAQRDLFRMAMYTDQGGR